MENKQTAVEWLVEQLINVNRKNYINNRILPISKNSIQDKDINQLIQQAKQMEKEQIKDADTMRKKKKKEEKRRKEFSEWFSKAWDASINSPDKHAEDWNY